MNNYQKGFVPVLVLIIGIAAVVSGGAYYYSQKNNQTGQDGDTAPTNGLEKKATADVQQGQSNKYPKKIADYTLTNTSVYEDCDTVNRTEAVQVGLRPDFRVCVSRTTIEYSKENREKIIVTHDVVTNGNDLVKKYSQTYFSKHADAQGMIKPSSTELMWLVKDSGDYMMVKEYGLGNNGLYYRAPSLDNAVVARYRKDFPRE